MRGKELGMGREGGKGWMEGATVTNAEVQGTCERLTTTLLMKGKANGMEKSGIGKGRRWTGR